MTGAEVGGPDWAISLADGLLQNVPRRLAHTRGAVAKARSLTSLSGSEHDVLVAAVALHDIGFSPDLPLDEVSGFPLYDAVRYLQSIDAPARLVGLVANHANARHEATLRGFGSRMAPFEHEGTLVSDTLWLCCLTVGPDGQAMTIDQRVEEWLVRYSDDSVMAPFTEVALPELRAAAARAQAAIDAAPRSTD